MKRFLCHIIFFALGFALLYLPTVWIVGHAGKMMNVSYVPANYGHSGLRLAEADTAVAPQLLFIGSSHCYRTFDTRCFDTAGIRCFNLGSSNQTPRQSLALLQRYLDRWHPRLVLFEVHPDIMENSGDEAACDLLSNTRLDRPMLTMALRQCNLRVFNTMVCAAIDQWLHGGVVLPQKNVLSVATSAGDTNVVAGFHYVRGGFVELPPFCYRPKPLPTTVIQPRSDQLAALADCLQLLNQKGVPYLLIEVPSTRQRYASYSNHADFERVMIELAGQGRGTGGATVAPKYINLNDDPYLRIRLDDTVAFFDDDHLNQLGVNVICQYLLSCIYLD